MAFGITIGPRFFRVRASTRGVRAYGSVGVGPVSYGWTYGGSGGRRRGSGNGGTRTVYVERLTAAEIRAAAEEEDRIWEERRAQTLARRAERAERAAVREAEYRERRAQSDREWAERQAEWERERAEYERERERERAEQRAKDVRELRTEAKSWAAAARRAKHTHVELFLCWSIADDGNVVVATEDVERFVMDLCPTAGWEDEPRVCMLRTFHRDDPPEDFI